MGWTFLVKTEKNVIVNVIIKKTKNNIYAVHNRGTIGRTCSSLPRMSAAVPVLLFLGQSSSFTRASPQRPSCWKRCEELPWPAAVWPQGGTSYVTAWDRRQKGECHKWRHNSDKSVGKCSRQFTPVRSDNERAKFGFVEDWNGINCFHSSEM